MEVVVTTKIKLLPNEEQKELLLKTLKQMKDGLNFASEVAYKNNYLAHSKKLQKLVYNDLREKFGLKSQMACNACNIVSGNYATEVTNKTFGKVFYKNAKLVYSYGRDFTFAKNNLISIGTLEKRAKMPYVTKGNEKYFDGSWEFATSELKYKKGKFYLHISVKKEIEEPEIYKNVVGVDLGMRFLATAIDSKDNHLFWRGGKVTQIRAKHLNLRKRLQECGTKSAKRKLKKLSGKERRFMTNENHCVSKALVRFAGENSIIALENLEDINITTKVRDNENHFRYHRMSWAFYQLRQFIEYKAKLNKSIVVDVDPAYTSQKCPKCGHTHKENRNKDKHIFECKACNYKSNDDRIGAINLRQLGIEYHSRINKKEEQSA